MLGIKILISHHEKRSIVQNSILTPIQTGCALTQERFEGMLYDDEGENISAQNSKYCELTAIYWAWKNYEKLDNPDYVGLMHNRRHLLFNEKLPVPDKGMKWLEPSVFLFPPVCAKYLPYISRESICSYFPNYDILTIKPHTFTPTKYDKVYAGSAMLTRFMNTACMEKRFFDVFINTVKQYRPDYVMELKEFLAGNKMYLCNIFVMRKDLFMEYCSFLFPLLAQIDFQIDSDDFCPAKKRWLGYLGEYLTTLFMLRLKKRPQVKMRELNASFLMEKNKKDSIKLYRYALMGIFSSSYRKKYCFLRKKLNIFRWGEQNA